MSGIMGHKIKSLIVLMVFATIISIGLTSNVAYAGFSIAASEFGIFGTTSQHVVIPGPCNTPTVAEGCVAISQDVIFDPSEGGWIKELDMSLVIDSLFPTGLFPTGFIIHIEEELTVVPLGTNPSGEWTDWHQVSQNNDWAFLVDPAQGTPLIVTPSGTDQGFTNLAILQVDPTHFFDVWLDFDPIITSSDPAPQLIIFKYIECINPEGCFVDPAAQPVPQILIEQFPTLDIDFGDLEDPNFPTLLASDGARHELAGLVLGATRDGEPDGQPTAAANGDDMTGIDDEDNISITSLTTSAGSVTITTTGGGVIDAWIDFNLNGVFDLPTEKLVFAPNAAVANGANLKTFNVPASAIPGTADSRWRVSTAGAPLPTGYSPNGEVEDHLVNIMEDGNGEPPIGGTLIPVDSTSLILAGAQMTAAWMIPLVVAGFGIGLVFLRKFKN